MTAFLSGYDLGRILSFKGIAEGVENSNYLLRTETGPYILTLYEKRVKEADLPFFIGLMEHLATHGVVCPQPVRARSGEALGRLCGRAATIVTFLEGLWLRRPQVVHCGEVGEALARMHKAGAGFQLRRDNALSLSGWRPLFEAAQARAPTRSRRICATRPRPNSLSWPRTGPKTCPRASSMPTSSPTMCSSSTTSFPG